MSDDEVVFKNDSIYLLVPNKLNLYSIAITKRRNHNKGKDERSEHVGIE